MIANNKIKILLARNAYSWQYGGAEKLTLNLAEELIKLGVDAVIATRVPELVSQAKAADIKVIRNIWLKNRSQRRFLLLYFLSPILILQYWLMIKRFNINLVILGSRDDQIFGTVAARLAGIPTVWIDHGDMKHTLDHMMLLSANYYSSLSKVNKIIVVSEAERLQIAPKLRQDVADKIVVINNGATIGNPRALVKPHGKMIVAYIGRLEADKGLFDLLTVAGPILKHHQNVEFWLVGKGEAQTKIEAIIQENKLSGVKLLGHIDDIGSVLKISSIFVYPTKHDASPLAPIEAILYGVPVVASRIGGLPELINDRCGILVPPNDPPALSAALNILITDDSLRHKLSRGALSRSKEFELGHIVKTRYLPLIKSLVVAV